MTKRLYKIRNINCQYPKSKNVVLEISELDIYQNEIVFFLGASGVGKSTILETLGLMSNTVSKNNFKTENENRPEFIFDETNIKADFIDIWNSKFGHSSEKRLSKLRKEHFSFIFQQTNLFPHLTAYQNANITQIIQGKSNSDSTQITEKVFDEISLDFKNRKDTKITNVSGGQRQRIAFARAISSVKDVLFADEPTGNLDWYNADNLIEKLKNNVLNNNSTAIIVSHDINLAIKFASKIVVLNKKHDAAKNLYYGSIDNKCIFIKQDGIWKNDIEKKSSEEMELFLKETIKKQSDIFNNKTPLNENS